MKPRTKVLVGTTVPANIHATLLEISTILGCSLAEFLRRLILNDLDQRGFLRAGMSLKQLGKHYSSRNSLFFVLMRELLKINVCLYVFDDSGTRERWSDGLRILKVTLRRKERRVDAQTQTNIFDLSQQYKNILVMLTLGLISLRVSIVYRRCQQVIGDMLHDGYGVFEKLNWRTIESYVAMRCGADPRTLEKYRGYFVYFGFLTQVRPTIFEWNERDKFGNPVKTKQSTMSLLKVLRKKGVPKRNY